MLKRAKRIISVVVTIVLMFNLSFQYSTAIIAPETAVTSGNKLSEALINKIETMDDDDTVSVMIWYEDINLETIDALAEKNVGYTQADIKSAEDAIPAIDESIFDLHGTAYTNAINNYKESTKEERLEVHEMQDKLIMERRKLKSSEYRKYNTLQENNANVSKKSITYTSRFSPVTIAELTFSEIYNLSAKENIVYMGYDNSKKTVDSLGYATTAVQADYTRDTLGFDGYGVKVGMCETGSPKTHSELNSAQITNISGNTYVTDHATYVARVIMGTNGVAPNASLYTTNIKYGNTIDQIEDLVSAGVNVINYSAAVDREDDIYYDDGEMWFDHIVSQHNISLVVAAGNNGVTNAVTIPGLAYNAITVGGTDTKFTSSRDDDSLYNISKDEGSCSGNGGTSGCAKPDLLAPAVIWDDDIRGTSLAAPVVTGIIAQMMEYKPTLKDEPESVKAILTASTDKKVLPGASPAVTEKWEGTITAQQGAGQVNAKRAISILGKGRYVYGTMSSGTVSKTFTVSSSDSWIRYCVTWSRNNFISKTDHDNTDPPTAGTAANLRLRLYDSDGTSMGSSNITTSSVELVHFTVGTTGSHTAKITRMDSGTNSIEYAVAWY